MLDWLDGHPGWLLIVDNVDTDESARELERLLARLQAGHVLITSRIGNWSAGVEPLALDVLPPADAEAFLLGPDAPPPQGGRRSRPGSRDRPRAGRPGSGPGAGRGLHRQAEALASLNISSGGRPSGPRCSAGMTCG